MTNKDEKMIRISATIPEPIAEDFTALCRRNRRSVSAQLTLLMEAALRHEEDAIDAEVAKLRKSNATYISAEQFWADVEAD